MLLYMDNIQQTFESYFNTMYKKNGYLDKYGGSVVLTGITLFFFFLIFSYYYVQSKIEPIRRNWVNERCKPEVMPFAGIINAPKGESKMKYASKNFYECTTTILGAVVSFFVKPYYYMSDMMVNLMKEMMKSVNIIRLFMDWLRIKLNSIFSYLIARIVNIMVPLRVILIKLKDTMNKVSGIMAANLFTVYSAYLALKAFMGAFLHILIIVLSIILAIIVAFWILPFTWPLAAAGTSFFLIISIPLIILTIWTVHVLQMQSKSVPGPPSCFDKNTIIKTKNGEKKIKNLNVGDILHDGTIITAVMKLVYNGEDIFKLNGIIVTGSHKILHDKLGWIYVKNHPDSVKINNYNEPDIYNLGTDTKRISINNMKFLDWDDLEPIDIIKLKNLNYLSSNAPLSDIHKYLESGISGDIYIELEDGLSVKIKDLELNTQLKFGERVMGIVTVDSRDICVKKYSLHNLNIIGAPNLHFKDVDLGNFNTLNIDGEEIVDGNRPEKLYHLVTDTGFFMVNGYRIRDYNSAIENILDIRDKLMSLF